MKAFEHPCEPKSQWARSFPSFFKRYLALIGVLFCCFLLALLRVYLRGRPLLYAHQWTDPKDIYGDFWHYRALLERLHSPEFFTAADRFAYPAPCAVLLRVLYHLGSHPHVSFNLLLWAAELISAGLFCRFLVRSGIRASLAIGAVLLMVLSSFPWFTLYVRANIEVFVYVAVALGTWAWTQEKDILAAGCWGVAASLKIYPLLLLLLFARRTRWHAFAVGVLTFAGTLLAAFWYVGPTIAAAARGTLNGITGFTGNYAVHAKRDELWLDHSFLGCAKEILSFPALHLGNSWTQLNHGYYLLLLLALPPLYGLAFRKLPQTNQLCLLLTGMMVLPPVSYDYTLIYMYLVLGLVLASVLSDPERRESSRYLDVAFICFALLSCSESWLRPGGLEFNPVLKCASLLTLAVVLFRFPLRMGKADAARSTPRRDSEKDTYTHAHSTHAEHLA